MARTSVESVTVMLFGAYVLAAMFFVWALYSGDVGAGAEKAPQYWMWATGASLVGLVTTGFTFIVSRVLPPWSPASSAQTTKTVGKPPPPAPPQLASPAQIPKAD